MQAMQSSRWRSHVVGVVVVVLAFGDVTAADTICVPDDYDTIQEAIDAAVDGDEICVASGTYNEAIDFIGKAVRLYSKDGPEVTILDGAGLDASVVTCTSGEGPETVLDGFGITGGVGTLRNGTRYGGGMLNRNSSPTVVNCEFVANGEYDYVHSGVGMYNEDAHPEVTNTTFVSNGAFSGSGGGMRNVRSNPVIRACTFRGNGFEVGYGGGFAGGGYVVDCVFTSNHAESGGGMSASSGTVVINCTFRRNYVNGTYGGFNGGGLEGDALVINSTFEQNTCIGGFGGELCGGGAVSHGTLINCVVANNGASVGGGVLGGSLVNCTVVGNDAWESAGGVWGGSLVNCIVWGNSPDQIRISTVRYSCVEDGYDGLGNIDADPLFVNFRLRMDSPCIDAGDNDAVPEDVTTDLDGNPRFVDDPDTEDTGHGDPPIVDMGAYEFQVPCSADIDGSGAVDFGDILAILSAWGQVGGAEDLDGSGTVDFGDLLRVLRAWGPCP